MNSETSLESLGFYTPQFGGYTAGASMMAGMQQVKKNKAGSIVIGIALLIVLIAGILLGLERKGLEGDCQDNATKAKTAGAAPGSCGNKKMMIAGAVLLPLGLLGIILGAYVFGRG